MTSVAKAIFFEPGIELKVFGKYSIQIGDGNWWDSVGAEPPRMADERAGMLSLRATRLLVLVCKLIRSWGVSDEDAIDLPGTSKNASFETVVGRSRKVFFASVYAALALSSDIKSPNTWFHRTNRY